MQVQLASKLAAAWGSVSPSFGVLFPLDLHPDTSGQPPRSSAPRTAAVGVSVPVLRRSLSDLGQAPSPSQPNCSGAVHKLLEACKPATNVEQQVRLHSGCCALLHGHVQHPHHNTPPMLSCMKRSCACC